MFGGSVELALGGRILEPLSRLLGACWEPLEASWGGLGDSWGHLERFVAQETLKSS